MYNNSDYWSGRNYRYDDEESQTSQSQGRSVSNRSLSYGESYSYQTYPENNSSHNWNYNATNLDTEEEAPILHQERNFVNESSSIDYEKYNKSNYPKYQDNTRGNRYEGHRPSFRRNYNHGLQSYYRQPYNRELPYPEQTSDDGQVNESLESYQDQEHQNYNQNYDAGEDNYQQGEDNYQQGEDNYQQGEDNYQQGEDNYQQGETSEAQSSNYEYGDSNQNSANSEIQNYDNSYASSQYNYQDNYSPNTYMGENSNYSNGINYDEYSSPLKALENKRGGRRTDSGKYQSLTKSYTNRKRNISYDNSQSSPDDNRRPPPIDIDPSLPQEISDLFTTNFCNLCGVQLNSRIQAKFHYSGKPHARKLKTTLEKREEDTSSKEPSIATTAEGMDAVNASSSQVPPSKKKKKVVEADQLYCKVCDLSFTSTDHATQHYLGRNHERVLHGFKPLKTGYFNDDTGKWQRMPPDPITPTERLTESEDTTKEKERFFCDLCSVGTTSKEQMEHHLAGNKHRKNQIATKRKKKDSILASVIKPKDTETRKSKLKDFSIYRTPSGQFYCSECDITMNSESQFSQHVDSKKHKIKRK